MKGRPIISEPTVMFGKPVVEGTRITVEQILLKLASGYSIEKLIEDHPALSAEDIRSALEYAAHEVGQKAAVSTT